MTTHCIYCAEAGLRTRLVITSYGGVCPIHSRDFLESLQSLIGNVPRPKLADRANPHRPPNRN